MTERKSIADNFKNLLDPKKEWNIYSQHSLKLAIKFKNESDKKRDMTEIKREHELTNTHSKKNKPFKLKPGAETWVIVESLDLSNPAYFVDDDGNTVNFDDEHPYPKGSEIKNGEFHFGKIVFYPGSSVYLKNNHVVEKVWGSELTKTEHKKALSIVKDKGRGFPLVLLKQTVDSLFGEKVTLKELEDCVEKGAWDAIEKKHQIEIRFFQTHGKCLGHVVTKEEAGSVLNSAGRFIPGKGIVPGRKETDTPLLENDILAIELDKETSEVQKNREFWIREDIKVPFLIRTLTPQYVKFTLLEVEKATKTKINKLIKEIQTNVVEACQDTTQKFVPRENVTPSTKKKASSKKASSKKASSKKASSKKADPKKVDPKKKSASKKAVSKKKKSASKKKKPVKK